MDNPELLNLDLAQALQDHNITPVVGEAEIREF